MKIFSPLALTYVFLLLIASCAKSEYFDFEKTDTGLMYKFHIKTDDTVHAQYGDVVRLKFTKCMGDSLLESSELVKPDGLEQLLKQGAFLGAVEEGITLMSIGDSATFLINTDSINKYYPAKNPSRNFKSGMYLTFNIKLMNIQTEEEAMMVHKQRRLIYVKERKEKELSELSTYITDNHIDVLPTKSGLYLLIKKAGKGRTPVSGDSVTVHYTGSFLDGTIFDSSLERKAPFGFVVDDQGPRGVIAGWNEAIKMMKKGSVSTIIIPSSLAYDSSGYINPQTGKYFIPPYAPMKFDIELIDAQSKNKK